MWVSTGGFPRTPWISGSGKDGLPLLTPVPTSRRDRVRYAGTLTGCIHRSLWLLPVEVNPMDPTPYHAKYIAHELTRRWVSDSVEKLLASSTYAISDTLSGLASKLENAAAQAEAVDAPPTQLAEDWDEINELADGWEPDEDAVAEADRPDYLHRVRHPLAQRVLAQAMALNPAPAEVEFSYSGSGKNIAALTPLVGKSGWLTCCRLEVQSLEGEDTLLLAAVTDDHEPLDETASRRLFDVPGRENGSQTIPAAVRSSLADAIRRQQGEYLDALAFRNGQWLRYGNGEARPLGRRPACRAEG